MLKQIVDGLSYNSSLLWTAKRFFPNALAQLDPLRRANNYRARWIVVPDSIDTPIQPYDTMYYQFQVSPGSRLWGWNFASISATLNGNFAETTPADLLLQLIESCSEQPLFIDYANANGLSTNGNSRCLPMLLNQNRVIQGTGTVNASVSNRTRKTITCQWLLHFAEPCQIVEEREGYRGINTVR